MQLIFGRSCFSSNNWIKVDPYMASFDSIVLLMERLFMTLLGILMRVNILLKGVCTVRVVNDEC